MLGLSIGFTSYQCHGHARPRFGRPVVMSTPDGPFFSLSASEKELQAQMQALQVQMEEVQSQRELNNLRFSVVELKAAAPALEQLTTPPPSEAATQAVQSAVEPMAVATDAVTAIVNAEGSPYMIDFERGATAPASGVRSSFQMDLDYVNTLIEEARQKGTAEVVSPEALAQSVPSTLRPLPPAPEALAQAAQESVAAPGVAAKGAGDAVAQAFSLPAELPSVPSLPSLPHPTLPALPSGPVHAAERLGSGLQHAASDLGSAAAEFAASALPKIQAVATAAAHGAGDAAAAAQAFVGPAVQEAAHVLLAGVAPAMLGAVDGLGAERALGRPLGTGEIAAAGLVAGSLLVTAKLSRSVGADAGAARKGADSGSRGAEKGSGSIGIRGTTAPEAKSAGERLWASSPSGRVGLHVKPKGPSPRLFAAGVARKDGPPLPSPQERRHSCASCRAPAELALQMRRLPAFFFRQRCGKRPRTR